MPRKRKTYVAKGHHPFVTWIDEELAFQCVTEGDLAAKAGLGNGTISSWRTGATPTVANFDAALQVLGYRLAIVDIGDAPYDTGV